MRCGSSEGVVGGFDWWEGEGGGRGGGRRLTEVRKTLHLEKRMKPAVQVHVLAIAGKRIACICFQGRMP